jgi:hypothetical protein
MAAPLTKALAVAAGGAAAVGVILLTLVLLSTPGGLKKAASFYAAYLSSYAAIGLVTITLGHEVSERGDGDGGSGAGSWAALAVSTLMLTLAFRQWRKPPGDDGPPKFLQKIDGLTARRLFMFGLFVPVVNFKNMALYLSAVGILVASELTSEQRLVAFVIVLFFFCSGLMTPIVLFAVGRKKAEPLLHRFRGVLERNTRPISIVLLSFFGTAFLIRGLWGVLG